MDKYNEEAAIQKFKDAWHKADSEGREGERVRDGLRAVIESLPVWGGRRIAAGDYPIGERVAIVNEEQGYIHVGTIHSVRRQPFVRADLLVEFDGGLIEVVDPREIRTVKTREEDEKR